MALVVYTVKLYANTQLLAYIDENNHSSPSEYLIKDINTFIRLKNYIKEFMICMSINK